MATGLRFGPAGCSGISVDAAARLAGTHTVDRRSSQSPPGLGPPSPANLPRTGVGPNAFLFRSLTEPDARQIAGWRYPPPYDFYDLPEDAWPDLLGLGDDFQAVDLAPGTTLPDPKGAGPDQVGWLPTFARRALTRVIPARPPRRAVTWGVAGFVCLGAEAQVAGARDAGLYRTAALDIGIGLRPDLTGLGLGEVFFAACLAHALRTRRPASLRLAVATFNQRAIRVYERAGFRTIGTCPSPVRGRPVPFRIMVAD